jgi:hypothetical protein
MQKGGGVAGGVQEGGGVARAERERERGMAQPGHEPGGGRAPAWARWMPRHGPRGRPRYEPRGRPRYEPRGRPRREPGVGRGTSPGVGRGTSPGGGGRAPAWAGWMPRHEPHGRPRHEPRWVGDAARHEPGGGASRLPGLGARSQRACPIPWVYGRVAQGTSQRCPPAPGRAHPAPHVTARPGQPHTCQVAPIAPTAEGHERAHAPRTGVGGGAHAGGGSGGGGGGVSQHLLLGLALGHESVARLGRQVSSPAHQRLRLRLGHPELLHEAVDAGLCAARGVHAWRDVTRDMRVCA